MGDNMNNLETLRDIVEFNSSFKTAINLYLSLNKIDKVSSYIPTKSSVGFLVDYLDAVIDNKEQATLLIGPYGKGKSHLLLVLLAILSMHRNNENEKVINDLVHKVYQVDEIGPAVAEKIEKLWAKKPFVPVLISNSTGDLNQAFLYGLNDALKREGLSNIAPETYYSIALDRIEDWEINYVDTYEAFENELANYKLSISELVIGLKSYSRDSLNTFRNIFPKVTAGSEFNPLAVSDVLPLYKSVSEKLVEDYEYSGLYIIFDEFSKFIESQDGIAAGANMELLQKICELSTNSEQVQVFFTMVTHKSIKEYGKYLSAEIINSFTGIEGRLIEKYFITSSKNNYELIKNAIVKNQALLTQIPLYEKILGEGALREYYQLPAFRSTFQKSDFENIILKGCYPLNPIAAYLLLNISEKVAQNERTLFTFISNDEKNSMARFVKEHHREQAWVIGADLIYNYFSSLFKKDVANEFIHNIWLSAEYALGRCKTEDQKKLIKALAIVLIVNKEDEIPADEKYLSLCVDVDDSAKAFNELLTENLLYKKSSTGTFVFKTRAGSELKSEIKRLREIKGENVNYAKVLSEITGRYHVIPRKYNTLYKMTRYFSCEYMEAEAFLNIGEAEAILGDLSGDGKVIKLFAFTEIDQQKIIQHVEKLSDERLVVVCPKHNIKAKKSLRDFEIIKELQENQTFRNNHEILVKELPLLLEDLTTELENLFVTLYETDKTTKVLFFDGKSVVQKPVASEEEVVNTCCESIYKKTVIINNEMINRSVINTSQTKKARINIINAILNHTADEDFYSGSNQEATIYRSLFCQTGFVGNEISENMQEILSEINLFIESCCDEKISVQNLVNKLMDTPYGLRMGVIPIYLAYVFSNRREDIIVYFADKEIQLTAEIVVNMCEKADDYALFVSKEDLQKEKYISELNILFDVADNRNLTANRIKDIIVCMQRWFRALPQVSRNLVDIDEYIENEFEVSAMKTLKKSMQRVEYNPFEMLFLTLPKAFGKETLEEVYVVIDNCKTYYDDYFDWLQVKVAESIYEIWGGRRKFDLFHTLKEWYDKQSIRSKQGLHNGRTTNLMSCIERLSVYNDSEVSMKIVKAVTDVYMENWNVGSFEGFVETLNGVKKEVESIKDEQNDGEMSLVFTGRNGNKISKLYNYVDESTGSVLRNIIEDTLDEYDDLSVNDRVSILLEMIEKIIK